jgi:GTP-dependent phosphoenolpyruvate carboxykinase
MQSHPSNKRALKSTAVDSDYFANAKPQLIIQDPRAGGRKHATLMEAITNGKPMYFYEESPHQQQTVQVHVQVSKSNYSFNTSIHCFK